MKSLSLTATWAHNWHLQIARRSIGEATKALEELIHSLEAGYAVAGADYQEGDGGRRCVTVIGELRERIGVLRDLTLPDVAGLP